MRRASRRSRRESSTARASLYCCPRRRARSKLSRLLNRARTIVKDRYRLVFLDPVTGCATSCGREGKGYLLELPKKWIVDNYRFINDGMKVVKLAAANGTLVGLPLLGGGPAVASRLEGGGARRPVV